MADRRYETRVYVRKQCLLSEPRDLSKGAEIFGALAAIFVPLLIGKLIGGVSAALKKAGSENTLKASGRLATYLYQLSNKNNTNTLSLNPDLGCVIVVRGTFSRPDDDLAPEINFATNGVFLDPDDEEKRINRLNDNGIPVTEIAALFEARIVVSQDESAMLYEGRFLEVNEFLDGGSKRHVVVSLALFGAGQKEGEPTLSLAMMNLGEIRKETILGPDQLRSNRSTWLSGVGITADLLKAAEKLKFPSPNHPSTMGFMPITIEGVFAETQEANKALLFIADVLDASKEAVTKAVSDEILKDPAKAEKEAGDALEKLRQDEESAYAAYLKAKVAEAKLDPAASPTEIEVATFEVDRTRRAWQLKFRALKMLGVNVDHAE